MQKLRKGNKMKSKRRNFVAKNSRFVNKAGPHRDRSKYRRKPKHGGDRDGS